MKKILFCFLASLFLSAPVNATQSPKEWTPSASIIVKGEPLTILWEDPAHRPKVIVWKQDAQIPEPIFVTKEKKQIVIARKGLNKLPTELLIVPENQKLKPQIIHVEPETKEIHFQGQEIAPNEVWFWGFTPEDPCPMMANPNSLSISVRLIHKTSVFSSFSGAFVWKIALTNDDRYEIPFYFLSNGSDSLKSVSANGFAKANDISKAMCHVHHGGECKFTLETNKDVWGKSHQIIFKAKSRLNYKNCPI